MSYTKVSDYYNKENNEYCCKKCDYNTSYKCNMIKHLKTKKHENNTKIQKVSKSITRNKIYECECGKSYMHRQGLYLHRKKGCVLDNHIKEEIKELKNLILKISEQNKNTLINNCNFTNSFNNKNEIKIFLTEQCANALSIQEFIKQLTITIEYISNKGDGMVSKITSILERNLKPLSITNRPIHHIEKNEWFMKDDEEWKEDNGDVFVDKTHNKYQTQYLMNLANDNIKTENEDDVLEQLKLNTKELTENERSKIKQIIKNECQLSHN